jgi:hypothetical protein
MPILGARFPCAHGLVDPHLAENSHESIRMLHLGTEPSLRRVHGERFLPHNFMKKILVIGGWSSEDGLLTSHHRQIPRLQTARLAQSSSFVVIGEKGGDVATGMDS